MKLCTTCHKPIPLKRLLAKPDAVQCVPCLAANGDEILVRDASMAVMYPEKLVRLSYER